MSVLIGGGTGFIGTRLSALLKSSGYSVKIISRMPGLNHVSWTDIARTGLPVGTTAVVNLAGRNVLDPSKRWSLIFQESVVSSRIDTTSSLVRAIRTAREKPDVFVNISGVSLYKPDDKKVYTEDDPGEDYDFMSNLCIEWEKAATIPKEVGVRTVKIRTGVVLGREGGMIKSLIIPFWFGFGGPVGNGLQPLPWIHIDDLCNLIKFSIENPRVDGILNGVAPQIINNLQFSQAFGKALWRPAILPLPEFVVDKIFSKDRSVLLTKGPKVQPKRTLATGFEYEFEEILPACKDCATLFID